MAIPSFDSPGTARLFPTAVDLLAAAAERFGRGESCRRRGVESSAQVCDRTQGQELMVDGEGYS